MCIDDTEDTPPAVVSLRLSQRGKENIHARSSGHCATLHFLSTPLLAPVSPPALCESDVPCVDIWQAVQDNPHVFRDTYFHLLTTTRVGSETARHVPLHLFPLFSLLAGTAWSPHIAQEALVTPHQLLVALRNSLARHEWMAPPVLREFEALLRRCPGVANARKCAWARGTGSETDRNVPLHLFPLHALLAGTALPPHIVKEALVEPHQLLVALMNSIARHEWMASVFPALLDLLTQLTCDSCEPDESKYALAGVHWQGVTSRVGWNDMPLALLPWVLRCTDPTGETALNWYIRHGWEKAALSVVTLDAHQGDISARGKAVQVISPRDGQTPLLASCRLGLTKVPLAILHTFPTRCLMTHVDADGMTALHWACCVGAATLALHLLKRPEARDVLRVVAQFDGGTTPLILACISGLADVALAMLELDARACTINYSPSNGDTALHWACRSGLASVVRRMLEYEDALEVLNTEASFGGTPLQLACDCGHRGVCAAIQERQLATENVANEGPLCGTHVHHEQAPL